MWYCPGSIVALWVMERHGMRIALVTGFFSQLLMITMSVVGVHMTDPHAAYAVVWAGQARAQAVERVIRAHSLAWLLTRLPARRWWAPSASRCS